MRSEINLPNGASAVRVLRLEPTNLCSRNCIMCPNKQIVRNQGVHHLDPNIIPLQLFETLEHVVFLQNGEFSEARNLSEILRILQEHSVWLHVTTNGMSLSEEILERLLMTNLASITFSIDSTDTQVFKSIRRGCKLDQVFDRVCYIERWKTHTGAWLPLIQANVTIMRQNIEGLQETLVKLAETGVNTIKIDYVRIHRACVEAGSIDPKDSLYFHPTLSNRILDECRRKMAASGCEVFFPLLFQRDDHCDFGVHPNEPVSKYCQQPWTDAVIWANGNVTPCTGAQDVVWGNLYERGFESIWPGSDAQRFRQRMLSSKPPDQCLDCVCVASVREESHRMDWHVF